MSFHIDFIYESEQRSASLVSFGFVVRLLGAFIPVIVLLFGSIAHLQSRQLRNRLAWAEDDWNALQTRNQAALKLRQDLDRIGELKDEIDNWRNARLELTPLLNGIRQVVPPVIQLTNLRCEDSLRVTGGVLTRQFELKLYGRARGENPSQDVENLRGNLLKQPDLAKVLSEVRIPPGSFRADRDRDARREHRVFELQAPLIPKRFE